MKTIRLMIILVIYAVSCASVTLLAVCLSGCSDTPTEVMGDRPPSLAPRLILSDDTDDTDGADWVRGWWDGINFKNAFIIDFYDGDGDVDVTTVGYPHSDGGIMAFMRRFDIPLRWCSGELVTKEDHDQFSDGHLSLTTYPSVDDCTDYQLGALSVFYSS